MLRVSNDMRGLINTNMFIFGFKGIDHSKKFIPLLFIHPFAEQTHKKYFEHFWFLNILNHPLIIHILSLFDINNVCSVTLHHIPGSILLHLPSYPHFPLLSIFPRFVPCCLNPSWCWQCLTFPIETHPTQLANSFTLLPALRFPFLGLSLIVSCYISMEININTFTRFVTIQVRTSNCFDDNKCINVFNCCILVDCCPSSLHLECYNPRSVHKVFPWPQTSSLCYIGYNMRSSDRGRRKMA